MTRRNPLFPYVYRLGMPIFDRLFYRRYRRAAMSNATGRLLMVGLGPGTDLMFLPPAVTSVAVEPEAAMRRMASALARRRNIAVDIVDGIGESIPFPDNSFDSVHVGLVLCSVDNVAATLGEIRRVLAPRGRLVVLEHVRGDGLMGRFQDLIAKPWSWLASGEPSTPLPRPDLIPGDYAAADAPWCRPRALLICKVSPPLSTAMRQREGFTDRAIVIFCSVFYSAFVQLLLTNDPCTRYAVHSPLASVRLWATHNINASKGAGRRRGESTISHPTLIQRFTKWSLP
jgi:SAM-dependent methyltransferase